MLTGLWYLVVWGRLNKIKIMNAEFWFYIQADTGFISELTNATKNDQPYRLTMPDAIFVITENLETINFVKFNGNTGALGDGI